jgi:putative metalloprotease
MELNMNKWIQCACLAGVFCLVGCASKDQLDQDGLFRAGMNGFKAFTLTDNDVRQLSMQSVHSEDSKSKLAASNSSYSRRLQRMTRDLHREDKLKLNFKVYLTKDVNAFCAADGSVRVYSGLMDKMNDEQLLFVIGHEIGHAKLGHTKSKLQIAYSVAMVKEGISASSNTQVRALLNSQLGAMAESIINAQYSQAEESEADEYAVVFMKRHHHNPQAGIDVMNKFAAIDGGEGDWFSDHPASLARAQRIALLIKGVPSDQIPKTDTQSWLHSITQGNSTQHATPSSRSGGK